MVAIGAIMYPVFGIGVKIFEPKEKIVGDIG